MYAQRAHRSIVQGHTHKSQMQSIYAIVCRGNRGYDAYARGGRNRSRV